MPSGELKKAVIGFVFISHIFFNWMGPKLPSVIHETTIKIREGNRFGDTSRIDISNYELHNSISCLGAEDKPHAHAINLKLEVTIELNEITSQY